MKREGRHNPDINVGFDILNDFFHDIFDAVGTGLLIIDPDSHRIVDINDAAENLIGEARDTIIGSVCHRFICPAEEGQCPITDLHQTVDRSERILLTRDGRRVPVIKSVGYISIAGNRFLLENITDNTELKKSQARARESEEKIRAVFDQTFQFIGIMTPEGILTEANRSALQFSGVSEKDVLGKPFWETPWWTHSPELQDRLRAAIAAAGNGEFIRFEATHQASDGSLHYVDFSLKPVRDDNGRIVYLIPEGRDITGRKKIEDELRQKNEDLFAAYEQLTATEEELRQNYDELATSEKKLFESESIYQAIFCNTGTAMALVEENTIISLVNAEFEQMTGYAKQEVEGKMSWTQVVHPEDLERMMAQHRLRRTEGAIPLKHYEFRLVTKSGSLRTIFLTIDIIPGTRKSVASLMDVTDNRQMMEKLGASVKEKEVLIREIHHRVKNNLQIIISLLNLQGRTIPDPAVLTCIQECQNRVRAMALVHEKIYQSDFMADIEIKDYFRFLGQYLFDFYQVDPATVSFSSTGDPVRVGINTAIPLSLIINELLSNSLKHAFPKGRTGNISIRTATLAGDIIISVSDNGIGIPKDTNPESTKSLGLMLVKSLSDQIRAELTLERKQGTTFTLTIPSDCIR